MFRPHMMFAAMILGAFGSVAHAPLATARTADAPAPTLAVPVPEVASTTDQTSTSVEHVTVEELPGPSQPCCPPPCITYHRKGPKLCCGCDPPIKTVLRLKNPCSCCEVEVPICMPACCKGEPTVCWTTGLFCRNVAIYEWCCGFRVRISFKHCGDLIVHTWGR